MEYRIERDSMGEMQVPADKYWGAQTQRSKQNFQIGGEIMPREITHAFGILKKAAAIANHAIKPEKMTDEKLAAISEACDEVIAEFIAKGFIAKYHADPRQSARAAAKLMVAAEKTKKTLSPAGVSKAPIYVECLYEDRDFQTELTLQDFQALCSAQKLPERLQRVALRALEEAAGTEEFASGRLERPPEVLDAAMARLLDAADGALLSGAGTEAAEAFTLAACWRYAAGRLDARYAVLTEGTEKTARIELFLLCAAQDILEKTKRARGAVFFSATLAPFEAAKRMLGSLEGDACLALPSPFDKRQLDARILPIDLRYAAREANAPRVAEAIRAQLAAHPGNAMVFFPSYAYLRCVDALLAAEGVPGAAILREARGLTEEEKNALLSAFDKRDGRTVLLAVLGGAFAEGVDLAGERLQNVIVVSTGLPQMDARVRAMRRYHDENGADGAFLCMTLPGMVRVIQSAGRLIRTQSDHGALLLIDSRYQRGAERALLSGTLIGDALSG